MDLDIATTPFPKEQHWLAVDAEKHPNAKKHLIARPALNTAVVLPSDINALVTEFTSSAPII